MKNFRNSIILFFLVVFSYSLDTNGQESLYETTNYNKVKFGLSDFGKMWTFDDVPVEYFKQKYDFSPSQDWIKDVQLSALQFGNGCSGAFVSANGLIMTNHHCGRGSLFKVQKNGEDLLKNGFYASTREDERKVPGMFVDQLVVIKDITNEILEAFNSGQNDDEKVEKLKLKIRQIKTDFESENDLVGRVVKLYNGGKYSLYGYRRYNDIRLVMTPDFQIASTGWDWDNFTYPRYELDFAFYRAYQDDKPIETDNFFKWSTNGAEEDEVIFTVGRPGSTNRLISTSQFKYFRDYVYPNNLLQRNEIYKVYFQLFNTHPERESQLLNSVMSWGNSRKSYAGRLKALRDPYLLAKKNDFENELQMKVTADPRLKAKYSDLWKLIEENIQELKKTHSEYYGFTVHPRIKSSYFVIAERVIDYLDFIKENKNNKKYDVTDLIDKIKSVKADPFLAEVDKKLLIAHCNYLQETLGSDHQVCKMFFGGYTGSEAIANLLGQSKLNDLNEVKNIFTLSKKEIVDLDDPFINFYLSTKPKLQKLKKIREKSYNAISVLNQKLGMLAFKIFGNKFSPDATSTLRISDGIMKGYEYNGTIAPAKTTFYGLYDRYNSFNKKTYPWGMHSRWKHPNENLDLSTPICIATTNDIVGGNSGSSVINKNQEVVGLAHDGNLESLAGHYIYLEGNNRTVATDSRGLLEALKYVYKTKNLVKELIEGKID